MAPPAAQAGTLKPLGTGVAAAASGGGLKQLPGLSSAAPAAAGVAAGATQAPAAFTPIASQDGVATVAAQPQVVPTAAAGSSGSSGAAVGAAAGAAAGVVAGVGAGAALAGTATQESLKPLPGTVETGDASLQPLPTGGIPGVAASGSVASVSAQPTAQSVTKSGASGLRLNIGVAMIVGTAGLAVTLML